jgi:hypothetical protein
LQTPSLVMAFLMKLVFFVFILHKFLPYVVVH